MDWKVLYDVALSTSFSSRQSHNIYSTLRHFCLTLEFAGAKLLTEIESIFDRAPEVA